MCILIFIFPVQSRRKEEEKRNKKVHVHFFSPLSLHYLIFMCIYIIKWHYFIHYLYYLFIIHNSLLFFMLSYSQIHTCILTRIYPIETTVLCVLHLKWLSQLFKKKNAEMFEHFKVESKNHIRIGKVS